MCNEGECFSLCITYPRSLLQHPSKKEVQGENSVLKGMSPYNYKDLNIDFVTKNSFCHENSVGMQLCHMAHMHIAYFTHATEKIVCDGNKATCGVPGSTTNAN